MARLPAQDLVPRKRHLITDAVGLVLPVPATTASIHDSVGGRRALTEPAAAHPSATKAWATAATRPA
ncbi:hypothetical protein K7B10_37660 [Streptomyces flavotricini]|uniref:Transposase n=1 Tax=Streptomyces flavotricini TaxID=66888 RepID=A0ABS8EGX5_9ACTN|nr:hypothetical protein [Streptomyces flavotricini]MCC0100406.1 hypothetical protein [Streptomyces flavotricini]